MLPLLAQGGALAASIVGLPFALRLWRAEHFATALKYAAARVRSRAVALLQSWLVLWFGRFSSSRWAEDGVLQGFPSGTVGTQPAWHGAPLMRFSPSAERALKQPCQLAAVGGDAAAGSSAAAPAAAPHGASWSGVEQTHMHVARMHWQVRHCCHGAHGPMALHKPAQLQRS